jgi:prophage maintenance system killer protein
MTAKENQIVIFKAPDGRIDLNVRLEKETIWLNLNQMVKLFERDKSVISRHLHNVYNTKELHRDSTVAFFATVQNEKGRSVERIVEYFNLDAIISVGYRVNSKRGTQFRIWATRILREHVTKGYTINEKRLREENARLIELERTVELMGRVIEERELARDEADGLLRVIADYSRSLKLLDQYDFHKLEIGNTTRKSPFVLTYKSARTAVDRMAAGMREEGRDPALFGIEKDGGFKGATAAIYQTVGGKDAYPSVEEKAAHLLYFVVKDHGFVDGNKRIGAALFIWFLHENKILYTPDGRRRMADNALVALTLLIAESKPADKNVLIKVVVNLINRKNQP